MACIFKQKFFKKYLIIWVGLVASFSIASCTTQAGIPSSPTKTTSSTKTPIATTELATFTTEPTATPSKSHTPLSTPTPEGTSTPTPSPTPTFRIGTTLVSPKDGMVLLYVPEGDFIMGSDEDIEPDKPTHIVWLDAFWIDRTEITNEMYSKCVAAGSCADQALFPEKKNHPVVKIDWFNSDAYCRWAGRRLPNEAEWEKAARGTDGRPYPWGKEKLSCSKANYAPACRGETNLVGGFPSGASPYGALDMIGNAWEWASDWYNQEYYHISTVRNPKGPEIGYLRVIRGGSWAYGYVNAKAFRRGGFSPTTRYDSFGIRCAKSVSDQE